MKKLFSILLSCLVHNALTRAINVADLSLPAGVISAINIEAEANSEWLTIKYGVYPNQVGLQVFDQAGAQKMVTAFNSLTERYATLFRGQPIYVGHPDDPGWKKANPAIHEEAVGRITELRADRDGLKLKRALNEQGKRLTGGDAPAYSAFSPHWGMEPMTYQGRNAMHPVYLFSVGLTNRPQIPGTFIGLNEALPPEPTTSTPMNKKLIELLALLGITLGADATDAQATTAINEALPKVTTAIADQGKLATATNELATLKPKLTAAEQQVTTAVNEAATLRTSLATERAARAGVVITTAINEGRLTEAGRPEWLGKFTAVGADFGAVQGELGKLKKAINTRSQADIGSRRDGRSANKTRITAINEAIAEKMTKLGTQDRTVAYNALVAEGHELFTNDKTAE